MARSLTPDRERAAIAVAGMVLALLIPTAVGQVLVIGLGAVLGLVWLHTVNPGAADSGGLAVPVSRTVAIGTLGLFAALLVVLPVLATTTGSSAVALFDGFYRAGALVFGGGHVVLPLLQAEVVDTGLVTRDAFLAGYGAAQAVPGPLFSFAAYLGAVMGMPPTGIAGAIIALVAVFLPSALLIVGALPFWEQLRRAPLSQRALAGVNAAVVGLLAAALYDPVFTEGITSRGTMAIAAVAFVLLASWRVPAWAVVIAAGLAGFAAL